VGERTAALRESRERLRLLAARLQSAREEERTIVAREMHDELGNGTGMLRDLIRDPRRAYHPPPRLTVASTPTPSHL